MVTAKLGGIARKTTMSAMASILQIEETGRLRDIWIKTDVPRDISHAFQILIATSYNNIVGRQMSLETESPAHPSGLPAIMVLLSYFSSSA